MPGYTLTINNTDLAIHRHRDAHPVIQADEAPDRAGFDPERWQIHEDTGEGETFGERAGDHLVAVLLDDHDQVIARRRRKSD